MHICCTLEMCFSSVLEDFGRPCIFGYVHHISDGICTFSLRHTQTISQSAILLILSLHVYNISSYRLKEF